MKPLRLHGFTTPEILTVTAILAILAIILIPCFFKIRMKAWGVMSGNNLRQLTVANMAYAADNECFVPQDDWWNHRRWSGARSGYGQPYDPTKGLLADYLGKSRRVTPCPLFTHMMNRQETRASFETGSGGYGYNDYIGGGIAPNYTDDVQRLRISRRLFQVSFPSTTIMFATTALARQGGVQEYPFCHPPFWTDEYGVPQPFFGRPSASLHFRFNGKAIVSWCDGHISFQTLDDRGAGYNPYGGDAQKEQLGWFGPDENNGYWNPDFRPKTTY